MEEFKAILQEAAKHTFEKKELNDWFDDQDKEIKELLEKKKLNRNELSVRDRCKTDGSKKKLRKPQMKNHREFYAIANKIYGPKRKNTNPVRSKNGSLLTSSEEIKGRWVEHSSELFHQPSEADETILEEIS